MDGISREKPAWQSLEKHIRREKERGARGRKCETVYFEIYRSLLAFRFKSIRFSLN